MKKHYLSMRSAFAFAAIAMMALGAGCWTRSETTMNVTSTSDEETVDEQAFFGAETDKRTEDAAVDEQDVQLKASEDTDVNYDITY